MRKRGFPVTHTANGPNRDNLANFETGAGSSAKSWQRYNHSEKAKRKKMGRRKKEGEGGETGEGNREEEKGSGWKNCSQERQQGGLTGRAAGKLCDGHQRGGWGTARGGRFGE